MKQKIFLALLWSVSCVVHAATHKVARASEIAAQKTVKVDPISRQTKAKEMFDALPIDDSLDTLLGPVPPPRVESRIPKGGSLAEWSTPDPIPVHTFEPIRDSASPVGAESPRLSMEDWVSPMQGDRSSAASPISMKDWLHEPVSESAAASPVSMHDWLSSPREESASPKPLIDESGKVSPTIKTRLSGLVSRLKSPSPTSVTSLPAPVALHASVERERPIADVAKAQSVLNKLAVAAKAKAQQATTAVLKQIRSKAKKALDQHIEALITDLVAKAGGEAAGRDLVELINKQLHDTFGTTIADYNLPEDLVNKLGQKVVEVGVHKVTDKLLPSVKSVVSPSIEKPKAAADASDTPPVEGSKTPVEKLGMLKMLIKTKIADAKKAALAAVRSRVKSEVDGRLKDLINSRIMEAGGDAAIEEIAGSVNKFLGETFGTTLADYNIPKKLADEAKKQAIAQAVEKSTGLIKREHAMTVMNAGANAMRTAKGAAQKLGAEMGLTPEMKAQIKAEFAAFKKTVLQTKKSALDAVKQLRVKPAAEE